MHLRRRGILAVILAAGALVPALALGIGFIQTNLFSLASREALKDERWVLADDIRLAGDVYDDIFLLATALPARAAGDPVELVSLSGTFHNDVWAIGNRIVLTGIIQDHARFMARTIILSGSIANSSIFLGNTIHITRSADLAADAWLAGEDLIVEGWVAGKLTLVGKNVTLSGVFMEDVQVTAQDLVALPGTEIMGNLIYRGPSEFVPDSRVVIHGKIIRVAIPEKETGFSLLALVYQGWLFLGALLTAMLFMAIFPATTAAALQHLRCSPWRCLAVGSMGLALTPLVLAVSILSLIGIPLGLLFAASLAVLVYLAKITVALVLGLWFMRQSAPRSYAQHLIPLIIGLLFIYIGVNSGLFGLVVWLVVTAAGLGSLALTLSAGLPGVPGSGLPDPIRKNG